MAAVLEVDNREKFTGSKLKQIRKQGGVPGVLYGKDIDTTLVAVESMELVKTIREVGRNGIVSLKHNGETYDVMVYDLQVEPIKGTLLHVDFYAVDMKSEMDADVSIQLVGDAIGARDGGVVQQTLFDLSVRALPRDIPEVIEVNVEELGIGDSLAVSDLKGKAGYEINNDPEETIVSVTPPTEVPDEADGGEEPQEPELVSQDEEKSDEE
ncbi:50S ribosomal protein L25/general stress protein Ctc [Texcoconibacillus texcoconensis]|uniref:Large ribosomal subunit protein bL25 n=1 Tax=Texcoconibacillus texcoconensis TaxID=1095777 RepID=A0A840QTN3_9BACI|nr:50S ribosomal protein L25/general stress protein Ctc [Texcoconibacillus texcoconensis]MBB5174906.1 large subunit ribosomal protein L25 [Texcoconibacillus texcoconensis]